MLEYGQRTKPLPRGTGHHVLRRIIPLFGPYRWAMLGAGLFIAVNGLTVSAMPLFTKYVLDVAIPTKNFPLAAYIMLGFVAAMAARVVTWYIAQSSLLYIRERIIYQLRCSVFAHLQELCLRFHHRYNAGYLYDRTLGNASVAVGTFLSLLFNTLVLYSCQIVFAVLICLRLHAGMTAYVLGISAGYVFINRYYGGRIRELTMAFNKQTNEFAGQIIDLLRGVKTIKAFAMEQRVVNEFDTQLWPLQLRSLDVNKVTMRLGLSTESLGFFIQASIVVVGAYLAIPGHIKLGTMVAFISYQQMIIGMISALASVAGAYGAAQAGLEQMYEVIDEHPTVVDKPGAAMPPTVQGEIAFTEVRFSYDGSPVLNGISLQVPAGQSVALVGPSGGGKTTLTNLLIRFYDPDHGTITLDGRNIRELPLRAYRGLFGVVLQDPFLFNDTILNNLLAVKPEATEEELRAALERAQAWEFVVGLKGGWHFKVGEGGGQLSGGQRQRIALARCFLTNPRIMVLDEATSALDTQSERLVQQALQEIMQDRTVFVIAHRLSTVRNVDRILVVQQGRIVQDGSYETLCQTPGLFRDLHLASLQAGVEETVGTES